MTNAEKLMRVNNYLAEALIDADWRDMIEEYKTILLSREAAEREEQEKITREYILREAARIVCGDRNEQYGEPEDSFRAHMVANILCTVFLMSVFLTVVGTWIGSRQITLEPIRTFFYKWPRNFSISFAVELLVAQPIARLVMRKLHEHRDREHC